MNYKVGVVFDVKSGKFKSEINQNEQGVRRFGHSAQQSAVQTRTFNRAIDDSSNRLTVMNKTASAVRNSLVGLAAGFGGAQLASGLTQELAAFQDIRTRLQGLSVDATDYANKEKWLISLSEEHFKELNGLADGYSRLSALTQEKIITDERARAMLEGLSNAAARNGASNADLERVYYGLSQALGAGIVNMEDFRQVTEPLPDLMSKIARAAGQETSAGLKQLIGDGKLTSEVFGKHLVTALQEYDGAAQAVANNINTKYRNIKREYQLLAVELEQPIEGALLPTLDGLASGLKLLREETDTVIDVLQIGLVAATGHALNALSNKTIAAAKSTLASRKQALADESLAAAELKLAKSAQQRAIQEQAAAKRQLENATNTYARSSAVKNLAIANGQAAASERSLASARTTLATATQKLGYARKGLGVMSSLVGGLPGLLTLAAFGMYEFATSTGEAADEAERLNKENEKLNPFANYTFEQATGALARYKGQLELAKQLENETRTRFENPFFKEVTAGDVSAATDKVNQLTQTIAALQGIVNNPDEKLKTKPADTKPVNKPVPPKVLDGYALQLSALQKQKTLLGENTELAKIEYETSVGKYKDLLPAQKQSLHNLAAEIDKKRANALADNTAKNQAIQLNEAAQSYAQTLARKGQLTSEASESAKLAFEIEHGSLQGINDELRTHLELLAQKADSMAVATEEQLPFWEQMKEHIASTSQDFDVMWGNTFNNFAQGIGDATSTAILEGKNFGDAMGSIARAAVGQVISGLVQIGVKRLALFAIEKTIKKSAGLGKTAEAQAASLTAGIHAFSSTAAIPVIGPALAPGAMTAALAVTSPMVAGVAGLAGMAHDGITEVPKEGTWLLDRGERVVDSRTNADLKQALNGGGFGGSDSQRGGDVIINYSPNIATEGEVDFDEKLSEHADHIASLVQQYKDDKGESF